MLRITCIEFTQWTFHLSMQIQPVMYFRIVFRSYSNAGYITIFLLLTVLLSGRRRIGEKCRSERELQNRNIAISAEHVLAGIMNINARGTEWSLFFWK
ncbi:hypothetical protein PUN28_011804 [Cardiocondyla obscurior]|uniref:Uncharacterized protein n=1 Tax=Cardiocondyla obscurior TaxID=286306 RepID=A0AAW2FJ17_9HYME